MKKLIVSERWKEYCLQYSWADIFASTANKYPENEALVFYDKRINYREYLDQVNAWAKGLYSIGVKKGTHVGLWMTNRPEWCFIRLAVYKLGAVLIPLNTRYRIDELRFVLNQGDIEVLITEDNFLGKIEIVSLLENLVPNLTKFEPGCIKSEEFPLLKNVVLVSEKEYGKLLLYREIIEKGKDVNEEEIRCIHSPNDTIHIIYTSGTTGFPKGVETPSSCNVAFCSIRSELFNLDKNSRFLNVLPLFGNIGLSNHVMPLLDGGTLILAGARFDPKEILELIQKEKVTHTVFVPTMLIDILNHPDVEKYDLSSIQRIECSGAPVPQELIKKVKEKLGIFLNNAYGLSEAAGLSTWVPYGDTPEHVEKSVGLSLPNCELAILDTSTGEKLPPGKVGEICTKEVFPGSQHMKGYYKQPELTKECIRDGWLHSGDLGNMDEDGYIYITGRLKEMFTVGGFNVSPPEIENFLLTHPDIENVAVVGVPEERLGEVGTAFVKLKKDSKCVETDIIEFCKGKIADIKVPRYVFFVEDFPLTPQGKIQKFKLREKAIEELEKNKQK
ncbi:MAG: AMP-binding protein [Dethiobacter sp.]|jgi:fatty-acyl-CoA synthase|nr:MAG: AMP-binding protein [Dethiobacter sp.]